MGSKKIENERFVNDKKKQALRSKRSFLSDLQYHLSIMDKTNKYIHDIDLTKVDFSCYEPLMNLATSMRKEFEERKINSHYLGKILFIQYFTEAGRLLDYNLNKTSKNYSPDIAALFPNPESEALFVIMFCDPLCKYLKTYQERDVNKAEFLKEVYGFASLDLLKLERLYTFIKVRMEKQIPEEDVKIMARKLFNLGEEKTRN